MSQIDISTYRRYVAKLTQESKRIVYSRRRIAQTRKHIFKTHYPKTFSNLFSITAYGESKKFFYRWDNFLSMVDDLERRGQVMLQFEDLSEHKIQNLLHRRINELIPNCNEKLETYINKGFVAEKGWELIILNYLKEDKLFQLDDETIFILFLLKLTHEEVLELSTLPKTYLTNFLGR